MCVCVCFVELVMAMVTQLVVPCDVQAVSTASPQLDAGSPILPFNYDSHRLNRIRDATEYEEVWRLARTRAGPLKRR